MESKTYTTIGDTASSTHEFVTSVEGLSDIVLSHGPHGSPFHHVVIAFNSSLENSIFKSASLRSIHLNSVKVENDAVLASVPGKTVRRLTNMDLKIVIKSDGEMTKETAEEMLKEAMEQDLIVKLAKKSGLKIQHEIEVSY